MKPPETVDLPCCGDVSTTLYLHILDGSGFSCLIGVAIPIYFDEQVGNAYYWRSTDLGPYGSCTEAFLYTIELAINDNLDQTCSYQLNLSGCVALTGGGSWSTFTCPPFAIEDSASAQGTCADNYPPPPGSGTLVFRIDESDGLPAAKTLSSPSLPRRVTNWRAAIRRWKEAGKPERTPQEVERINRDYCRPCEHYDAKWQQCKLCGCFCRARGRAEFNKPAMLTERCPLEPPKWGGAIGLLPATFAAPMDVVYPISGGRHGRKKLGSKWDDNELRYSLRSLERYFPNMARVFIVGHKPDWLTGVIHLPAEDTHRKNKDANIIDKVLLACRSGVSPTFLRLSDDQCLLQPLDGLMAYHAGDVAGYRGGKWWRRMQRTREHLQSRGRPTWFYDVHAPAPVDRDTFVQVATEAGYRTPPGLCINTLYFNSIDIPRLHLGSRKASVHKPMSLTRLRESVAGKTFLGYSEAGTNDALKAFLQELFPTPSRFER